MSVPDYPAGSTIYFHVPCRSKASVPTTADGSLAFAVYKDDNETETTNGVTFTYTSGYDARPGLIMIKIVTTDAFYTSGSDFSVVVTDGTVDGTPIAGEVAARFSIEKQTSSRANVRAALGMAAATFDTNIATIVGYIDGVEGTLTTMTSTLSTIVGYTDQVETMLTAVTGYVDGVEATLASLPATIWNYNFATHVGTVPAYGPINALRSIRNKWALPIPGTLPGTGTYTVYAEDGTTSAFTQSVTFDSDGNITAST